MSSEYRSTSLADFGREETETAEEQWITTAVEGHLDDCRRCGATVSRRFARVMGDNDNHVWACPACAMSVQLINGAAADPDFDHEFHERGERL